MYRVVATCGFGLESVLKFEIVRLGVQDVQVSDGRILFTADGAQIARACLWLRTAERLLIIVGQYEAPDFDALYDGAFAMDWKSLIGDLDAFPVKGYSMDSALTSVPACQSVLKKAVVEKLKLQYGTRFLPERGAEKKIRFSIIKDTCTLMLDLVGDGLHKRGYRPLLNEAPIKETIAAGICDFARVREDSVVCDPFCGSGTLLIEAALRAKNIAPGLNRSFAAETYAFLGENVFPEARAEAREQIRKDVSFRAFGSDIDEQAVRTARENAKRAGVAELIEFRIADARDFVAPEGAIVLANPPYGERLSSPEEAEKLMEDFGRRIAGGKQRGTYVISSLPDFEKHFGLKANKRRKLYNGMISCQLYMYWR